MLVRDGRANSAGAEWFALLAAKNGGQAEPGGSAGSRKQITSGVPQSGRRTGRTGLRRRKFFVLNADCGMAAQLPAFREAVAITRWARENGTWRCTEGPLESLEEGDPADYAACVLGLRDYVEKNRFSGVVLGLSGGINSALCAAIAVDALGAARVRCIMLPYKFTSRTSREGAAQIAAALGVSYEVVPIDAAVNGLQTALSAPLGPTPADVTEQIDDRELGAQS